MKLKLLLIPLPLLLFFSCQKAKEEPQPPGEGITFSFGMEPATKVGYDAEKQPGFTPGDAIGVYARRRHKEASAPAPGEPMIKNLKFTLQGDGSWLQENANKYYYPSHPDSVLDFYAYYPYDAAFDPERYEVPIYTRILTAENRGTSKQTGPVALSFKHEQMVLQVNFLHPGRNALNPLASSDRPMKVQLNPVNNIFFPGELNLFGSTKFQTGSMLASYLEQPVNGSSCEFYVGPWENGNLRELVVTMADASTVTYDLRDKDISVVPNTVTALNITGPVDNTKELPNSYVVTPGAEMHIPVYKAYREWQNNEYLKPQAADLSGDVTAELLWMDAEGLIANADYLPVYGKGRDAVIQVQTAPGKSGNAVVAVKIGGVIRWSWHLWVTDYAPLKPASPALGQNPVTNGSVYAYDNNNDAGLDYVFMDRNLGATNATPGDAGAKGLYYQWGRKDPFTGTSDWSNTAYTKLYNADGEITEGLEYGIFTREIASGDNTHIASAATQPQAMYVGPQNPWGSGTDGLWGAGGGKSPFDPCPEGWRLPDQKNGQAPYNNLPAQYYTWNNGLIYTSVGYYPAGSFRWSDDGQMFVGQLRQGLFWYGYRNEQNNGHGLLIQEHGGVYVDSGSSIGGSNSVRCVAE